MPQFKTFKQLEDELNRRITLAVRDTQEEINNVLYSYVKKYYDEYTPTDYERTYTLLGDNDEVPSIVEPKVIKNGNKFSCRIGFTEEYLQYRYPDTWKNLNGLYGIPATGYDVLSFSEEQLHGGTISMKKQNGVKIWSDFIEEMPESRMLEILRQNLIKYKIPIF